jgi:hypothetical protein
LMGKLRRLLGLNRRREPVICCEECRRAASAAARLEKQPATPRKETVR